MSASLEESVNQKASIKLYAQTSRIGPNGAKNSRDAQTPAIRHNMSFSAHFLQKQT
jgi:hypothetical protein